MPPLSPVLSLVLFAHGCTLTTLGIALSVYSAAVLLLEVLGILSDLWGAKAGVLSVLRNQAVLIAAHVSFPGSVDAPARHGAVWGMRLLFRNH